MTPNSATAAALFLSCMLLTAPVHVWGAGKTGWAQFELVENKFSTLQLQEVKRCCVTKSKAFENPRMI